MDTRQPSEDEADELRKVNQSLLGLELPEGTNYSQAKRAWVRLVGPNARIWRWKENLIEVGTEVNGVRYALGAGKSYAEAVKMAAIVVAQALASEKMKKEKAENIPGGDSKLKVGPK